jgi:TPR repeat protein/membrane associated rhomboid family serine protease
MKRCAYCGRVNEDARAHCEGCGEALPGLINPPRPELLPEPAGAPLPADGAEKDAEEFTKHFHAATPRIWVVYSLLGLNALIFLLMGLESSNLLKPNLPALLDWGANWGPLTATGGGWWRLLAACFLHFSLLHVLCNLFALWQAGLLAERLFGNWFFLAIYLGSGLLSSLTALDWHPETISAGASGAVFGVYGALLGYLVRQRGDVPRRVWVSLGQTILAFVAFNLFYGLTQLKVDNAAHVGGLLAGIILGFVAARPLHLTHRLNSTRRTSLQVALIFLGLLLPLVLHAPRSRPKYAGLLNDMGENVARGTDAPRDPAAAAWWYRQAAQRGSAEAEFNLGRQYFAMDSNQPANPVEGVKWFRQAADHGSTNAEIALGLLYYNGTGVPTNHTEARYWITRAARRGDANEQFILGQMYFQGDGVNRDDAAAFNWTLQAADQGLVVAQAQLGAFYLNGIGTETNLAEAVHWTRAAANHGQPNAQFMLGSLYANGQGVARDLVEAYAWLSLAAGSPAPLALAVRETLDALAHDLPPAQMASARRRTEELSRMIKLEQHSPPAAR